MNAYDHGMNVIAAFGAGAVTGFIIAITARGRCVVQYKEKIPAAKRR